MDAALTIQEQFLTILKAIELLQNDVDELTATIDPDNAGWADVAKFAHTADMARTIVNNYAEQEAVA